MEDAGEGAPEPLIFNNETPMSANLTFCQTSTASESQVLQSHIRNVTIGILGIIANIAAAAIVSTSKKINSSLKIYLTSLTVNDIIFMAVLILPTWRRSSRDLTCTMLALGSVSSFAVANLMVALITFHNYQAVFNAIKFKLVSVRTVCLAVVVVWLLGWSLSLMCIGSIKPQNDVCRPPLKLPKFVYFLGGAFSALSAVFVLVLNFRVIYFIKSSSIVTPSLNRTSPISLTETSILAGTAVLTSIISTPVTRLLTMRTQIPMSTSQSNLKLNENPSFNRSVQTVDVTQDTAEQPSTICLANTPQRERSHRLGRHSTEMQTLVSEMPHEDLNRTSPEQAKHYLSILSLHVQGSSSRHQSPVRMLKSLSTNTTPHLSKNDLIQQDVQEPSCGSQESHVRYRIKNYIPKINSKISRSLSRNNRQLSVRGVRMRKVCVTLCIITLWCCSLNLPNFVNTMISISLKNGREKLDGSAFSLASTTLVLINCLSQPIIYVWRFVDWSRVFFKQRQKSKS